MTSPTTNKEPLKKDSPEIEEPKKKNNFFRSTYDELKLVVWPNKPVSYTHLTLPTTPRV